MLYEILNITYGVAPKPSKATLKDLHGAITQDVVMWNKSWPDIRSLIPGSQIEGEIKMTPKEYNGKIYENFVIYPPYQKKQVSTVPRETKSQQIAVAQDRKAEHIEEAQKRKDRSIAYFSSLNAAVELVKARLDLGNTVDLNDFQIQQEIAKWRGFFFEEWKKNQELSSQPF